MSGSFCCEMYVRSDHKKKTLLKTHYYCNLSAPYCLLSGLIPDQNTEWKARARLAPPINPVTLIGLNLIYFTNIFTNKKSFYLCMEAVILFVCFFNLHAFLKNELSPNLLFGSCPNSAAALSLPALRPYFRHLLIKRHQPWWLCLNPHTATPVVP